MRHLLTPALLVLLAACAGSHTRNEVHLPALQNAWDHIRVQVIRELALSPEPGAEAALVAADHALEKGDPILIATVRWPVLEELAEGDIRRRHAEGQLGPTVAAELRGRLADFAEARKLFTRDPR